MQTKITNSLRLVNKYAPCNLQPGPLLTTSHFHGIFKLSYHFPAASAADQRRLCPSVLECLNNDQPEGLSVVDSTGTPTLSTCIPPGASGLTVLIEALEVQTCITSELESCLIR